MKSDAQYKALSIREFTRAAEIYDGGHAGIYEMCKDDYPPTLEELKKDDFEDLLDVGCGTGPMVELLASEFPGRRYTGLDLTPKMVEVAEAKGIEGAQFVVGDAEDLPFDDASFDAVICANSFHHYPNPQAFFDGVARVLYHARSLPQDSAMEGVTERAVRLLPSRRTSRRPLAAFHHHRNRDV